MLKFLSALKPIHWLIGGVILSAAFLRLYNIDGSLMFLGDQGRDAILVKRIFKDQDPVFIGPVTSVGNMYLGPLYYYFMLPWLILSYPSPVGPAVGVAILGIITVWFIYFLGKKMVGEKAAIIATIFFTFSSTVVNNSRFSWNPNPAPLVSMLMIYFTWMAWKKHPRYWVLVSLFFSILIQLHYMTLLTAMAAGLIWLWSVWEMKKNKFKKITPFVLSTLAALILFIGSLTPLILFDIKHDFLNANAFSTLIYKTDNFAQNQSDPLTDKIKQVARETHGRGMHVLFEYNIGKNRQLNTLLLTIAVATLGLILFEAHVGKKKNKFLSGQIVIMLYLFTSIIGISLYNGSVFDHYISYLFPVSAFVYGIVLYRISRQHLLGSILAFGFFIFFMSYNWNRYDLADRDWSIYDIQRTAQTIIDRVNPGEKYNIVLLSESKDLYGQSYRYFLEVSDKPPLKIEEHSQAEALFVINEQRLIENVTDSEIYEIVVFPQKHAEEVYNVEDGPQITVLRKNTP